MKHFEKICKGIPVGDVMAELKDHPELWDQHGIRKTAPGTPHAGMSDIWVRYNDSMPFLQGKRPWSEFNDAHVPVNYPAWDALPSLRRIVFGLMALVEGEMLGGVLITKIPPGHRIEPHVDEGWHVEYFDKFYLSLQSAPGAAFHCKHDDTEESIEPDAGDIYRFDNTKLHWVTNDSETPRITAIICIRTEMFRR